MRGQADFRHRELAHRWLKDSLATYGEGRDIEQKRSGCEMESMANRKRRADKMDEGIVSLLTDA